MTETNAPAFQSRVQPWMHACFGAAIAADAKERNHRFLEEALELVQACGATRSEAKQLVDYVYDRPAGERAQEVGGVMVTLAALCLAQGMDMHEAGEVELNRIWTKVEQIRAKQAAKPKHSPLPTAAIRSPEGGEERSEAMWAELRRHEETGEPIWICSEVDERGEVLAKLATANFPVGTIIRITEPEIRLLQEQKQ